MNEGFSLAGMPGRSAFTSKTMRWLVAFGVLAGCAWVVMRFAGVDARTLLAEFKTIYKAILPESVRHVIWVQKEFCFSPLTWLVLAGVFWLERVIPAHRTQRVWSSGLGQDALWFMVDFLFQIMLVQLWVGLLQSFYNAHLSFLTVRAVSAWPLLARLLCSLIAVDFLAWLNHYIRHRVDVFWYFHMVHHSQRQLNVFTDGRVHPVEYLITRTIVALPVFMFQFGFSGVVWLGILTTWYARVYHANLKTNYGPLKYFMVTPQSHRIHHSIEPRHWNKNFSVLFTVWDRLFGTLYANYDEYPATGVVGVPIPLEESRQPWAVVHTYVVQWFVPFRLAGESVAGGLRRVDGQ